MMILSFPRNVCTLNVYVYGLHEFDLCVYIYTIYQLDFRELIVTVEGDTFW